MPRDQLEHTIRAACQIADGTEVIIVDSQAILGTYTEAGLPFYAARSVDIDVLPIADDDGEIARLASKSPCDLLARARSRLYQFLSTRVLLA